MRSIIINKIKRRINFILGMLLLFFAGILPLLFSAASFVQALQMQNQSVQLSNYVASATSDYTFQFTIPSTSLLGSIVFEYCSNSSIIDDVCNAPAGLDVSSATLTSQTANVGFSMDNADTTANQLVISRPPLAGAAITSSYVFSGLINPSAVGGTTFVRITTHASTDGSGSINDSGGVAYVTASPLNVAAFVPPFLRLCVGLSVATDCSSASGDSLDLGDLSANHANAGQSQFSTGTNSPSGYGVYVLGTTMTSGNDAIAALTNPTPSFPGNNQFGINLRANSNPPAGQDPNGVGNASPTANYGIANQFTFNAGDSIASSALPSDYNRMTVSYLANVNHNQNPGVYSTTLTYLAIAQF
jgi:hypothetical protein